jgi:hypothetical protein
LAVHISHHQVGYWFTKGVMAERPLLKNSGYKVTVTFLIIIIIITPKDE